jgi:hypothetical protein
MAERRSRRTRDSHFEQRGVKDLADFADHWIKLVAVLLAGGVGYLEFRNAQLEGFAKFVDNTSLIKAGLFIFFLGWGWGALDDTRIQARAYLKDPERGRIHWKEWAGVVLFLALFITLFLVPHRTGWFQLTLLGLIVVNTWTWRVIFDRTRPAIVATNADCASASGSRNMIALAKLLLVVEYMNGPWQRRRFITLIAFAAVQVPIAFLVASGRVTPLGAGTSLYGVPGEVLIGYLPGMLFILYVLVSEIWMKVYRVRVFADLRTAEWLEAHFTLGKQRDHPLPEPHLVGTFDFAPASNRNYGSRAPTRLFTSSA